MNSTADERYDKQLGALHAQARDIFARALQTASIPAAFDRRLVFEDGALLRRDADGDARILRSLSSYRKINVVAAGKAALPMLDTLLERLPRPSPVVGICCAPAAPQQAQRDVRYFAGGHPWPNIDSFRSARAALELLQRADKHTFVFFLISGGGSSLFEAPLDERITLEDTVAFYRALVGSGATIAEINVVRKHFSAVKGGRLAAAAGDAASFSLLLSDVPLNHLDALASGPTLPDHSTVAECRAIIDRYSLLDRFPPRVRDFFVDSNLPETPGVKKPRQLAVARAAQSEVEREMRPELPHSSFDVLLSNDDLIQAARTNAETLGWKVFVDNACDDWDYREAADYLLKRLRQLQREHGRVCLLSGGEVTVRLEGEPGVGGRNQQFALACAVRLAERPFDLPAPSTQAEAPIAILSAGSDGVDGVSPAAGAIADSSTVARAKAQGFDSAVALSSFDAYPLFSALGDTVITGPTNNNLRDLRILLSC